MLSRVLLIAYNSYREAVRARILHGLFGLALLSAGYALVVSAFASRAQLRVISDLGAASISIYGVLVAIVLGATSLYRELELKTIFPILARPIARAEYLVGKFLGALLTLAVFIAANSGALLLALSVLASGSPARPLLAGSLPLVAALIAFWRLPRWRTALPIPLALCLLLLGALLSYGTPDDRRVLLGSALLTLCEVGIVTACATVFSSFSSPFLTALFTLGVFVVGRSADTLGNLPERMFGSLIRRLGGALSWLVPNLLYYVPERTLLTGEAPGASLVRYLGFAALQAVAWIALLLTASSWLFRRRDFL